METKRNKIGFNFYTVETEIETPNPIEHINTLVQEKEIESSDVVLTPAHKETLNRIAMTEFAIKGKGFSDLSEDKKQELLDELVWLTEISAQLSFSY